MGVCMSSVVATAAARSSQQDRRRPTTNVISANGDLRQYTVPVTVSQVLLQLEFPILSSSSSSSPSSSKSAKFFVCNSDSLDYDNYIPALDTEDELQADQIYFVLPSSKLRYRLTASDMAALAVKASVALQRSSSNSKRGSSSSYLRHRRHRHNHGSQNKMARISPVLEEVNINYTNNQIVPSSSEGSELIVKMKKGFSDKPAAAPGVSTSGSVRKLQRNSSRRAKMALRSFRVRLTTINEGSVLQFF